MHEERSSPPFTQEHVQALQIIMLVVTQKHKTLHGLTLNEDVSSPFSSSSSFS